MSDVKHISPWTRDFDAFDPSARICHVEVDGRVFAVRNLLGPGWPMTVRPASNPHFANDMAAWENWSEVAAAARECLAQEARRAARLAGR